MSGRVGPGYLVLKASAYIRFGRLGNKTTHLRLHILFYKSPRGSPEAHPPLCSSRNLAAAPAQLLDRSIGPLFSRDGFFRPTRSKAFRLAQHGFPGPSSVPVVERGQDGEFASRVEVTLFATRANSGRTEDSDTQPPEAGGWEWRQRLEAGGECTAL